MQSTFKPQAESAQTQLKPYAIEGKIRWMIKIIFFDQLSFRNCQWQEVNGKISLFHRSAGGKK